jgi:iron complex outermembrane recepter protein
MKRIGALLCGTIAAAALHAQVAPDAPVYDPESATLLDGIVVTGTRIQRIEVEGPLPISTIERDELELSGVSNIADVLRELPYNSFGSLGDVPNSSVPTQAVPSLRGLGGKYTLTLLDGYRLAGATYGFSGAAASLTGIPMAAVDRVEVLRDGASAVYGSDAIGGVINLRTRDGSTPPQFEMQWNQPSEEGGESWTASFVAGNRGERSRWLLALETLHREPLVGVQRGYLLDNAPLSLSGNPGTFVRLDPQTNEPGVLQPDPRCPAALGSDPQFPNSVIAPVQFGNGTGCYYRYRDENFERAALDSRSLFSSMEVDLGGSVALFARALAIGNASRTQLAPSAVTMRVPAGSPINPTLGELGEGVGYPLRLIYRLTALGPRVIVADDTTWHGLLGFRGQHRWAQGGDWSLAVIENRLNTHEDYRRGFALLPAVNAAVASGRFDPFHAVPGNASGLEDAIFAGQDRSGSSNTGIEGTMSVDFNLLDGAPATLASGFDLRRDRFWIDYDARVEAGSVAGIAQAKDESAERDYSAFHVEAFQPLGERWQLDLALRNDRYGDAGSALSPKLALGFRPSPQHLLRMSLGRGFQAPGLSDAYGARAQGSAVAIDALRCAESAHDPDECRALQREVVSIPNAELAPERAAQRNLGWLWQPGDRFDLSVDYYTLRIRDQIDTLGVQRALENELDCAHSGRTCTRLRDGEVVRDEFGLIETIILPRINRTRVDTSGIDMEIGARGETSWAKLGLTMRASYVLDFEQLDEPGLPERDALAVFGTPRWRASLGLDAQRGAHGLHVDLRHTTGFPACLQQTDPFGSPDPDCGVDVGSHTEIDVQWRWALPWNGRLAVGGRNITDRELPLDPYGNFAYGLYDPIGRTWYLRYQQTF